MADSSSKPLHPEDGGVWIPDDQQSSLLNPVNNSFLHQSRGLSPVDRDLQLDERPRGSFLHFLNNLPPTSLTDRILHPPSNSALPISPTNSSLPPQPQYTTDPTSPTMASSLAPACIPPHRKPNKKAAKKKDAIEECDPWAKAQNSGESRAPMGWATVMPAKQEPQWRPEPVIEKPKPNQRSNTSLRSPNKTRGPGGRGSGRGGQNSARQQTAGVLTQDECQWLPVPLAERPKPTPVNESNAPLRSANRGRGQSTRGNTRGRGRAGFANNSERWARGIGIDKTRWDTHWDSASASQATTSEISSCWANAGEVNAMRKRAKGAGYEISGYDGKWAPAPIDWDSRPAFRESQSEALIDAWLDKIMSALGMDNLAISLEKNRTLDGHMAPRYWIPETIDTESLKNFWHEIVTSDEPPPEDYGDLDGVKPWWLTYKSPQTECEMIEPYQHKWEEVGINPADENQFERAARARDAGSATATIRRKNFEKAKKARKNRQQQRYEPRDDRGMTPPDTPVGMKSDLKLYIRTACNDDLDAVCEIYNHYVEFTTCVSEMERLSTDIWKDRLQKAFARKLPFLVAYKRGDRILPPRKRPNAEVIILPDTLVGFAYAKDFDTSGQPNMYEPTVEIEVYSHSMYLMKGVARCLVDQLLGQIDQNYSSTPGYMFTAEWDPDVDEFLPGGLPLIDRNIKNILIRLPYERPERLERVGGWLSRAFAFEEKGVLSGIGMKNEKTINLAIFQRPCNTAIAQ